MNSRILLLFIPLIPLLLFHCEYDKLNTDIPLNCNQDYTFQADIKDIVGRTCAYSTCHVSGGEGPGNFLLYDEVEVYIENERFQERVFTLKDMPPLNVPSENELRPEEIEILRCWIEEGYPQ